VRPPLATNKDKDVVVLVDKKLVEINNSMAILTGRVDDMVICLDEL